MYEHITYPLLLKRMLDSVPNNIDKREGSVIYDALAPAAAELAQLYIELDVNHRLSFADTASGEYLTRRCAEFGINRIPATKARRQGEFFGNNDVPLRIPIGSRYSIDNVNFTAIERISTGIYILECELTGTIGNQQFGTLLPINFINGLSKAILTEVLIPGQEEETDDALRERYYQVVNEPSFGGNVADYKQTINTLAGVGGSKVFPVWQGGGTVKCTIIASDYTPPTAELLEEIQTMIDPEVNQGQGLGYAPIGHTVTITGVTGEQINIETTLTLESGITVGQVQADIEDVIHEYLLDLRKTWVNQPQIIIRIAQIEARIVTVPGVADIQNTRINDEDTNITLEADQIPMLGTVALHV